MPPPHHHDHDHGHGHHHLHHQFDETWWSELSKEQQDAATALGWTQMMWDEDGWADTEDKYWDDLTDAEKAAAAVLGYDDSRKHEWDEHDLHHHHRHPHHHEHHHEHAPPPPAPKKEEEEKKDGEDEDTPDVSNLNVNDDGDKKDESSGGNKKPTFKVSKTYGGTGGEAFDHGTNRHISKIVVYHDGHCVKGLEVSYANATKKAGECKGKSQTLELDKGEFITAVTVRSNAFVQSLGFRTSRGKEIGPIGGKGWTKLNPMGNDTEGEETKVAAPYKFQLCGFTGRAGVYIDQVAFRWGPIPQIQNKKQGN